MITNWNDPISAFLANGPTEAKVLEILPDDTAVIRFRRRNGVMDSLIIDKLTPDWVNTPPAAPALPREVWLVEYRAGLGRAAYPTQDELLRQIPATTDRAAIRLVKFLEVLI
jgi:hypothetical protein